MLHKDTISLSGNTNQSLSGSAADLAAALAGISGYTGDITFSSAPAEATDISAVKALVGGDGTLSGENIPSITGTAANISAAFDDFDTAPNEVLETVEITGVAEATDITDVKGYQNSEEEARVDAIDGSGITAINGSVAAINIAVGNLGEGTPDSFNSTLSEGTASASAISTLAGSNGGGTIDASDLTGITGTTTAIISALALVTEPSGDVTATISGRCYC